jgi:accessory Sec system S-layer assembly protein
MKLFKRKNLSDTAEENISHSEPKPDDTKTPGTTLKFHPDWTMSEQEKYVYKFKHAQLKPLQKNQISISGTKLYDYNKGFVAVAFVRNTLSKPIKFEEVDLILLNKNGQAFAKKRFDLSPLGELPANGCMPWRFLFAEEDRLLDQDYSAHWTIAFELKKNGHSKQHSLDLEESWETIITNEQREKLKQVVSQLPTLKEGELNLFGISSEFDTEHNLSVTLLIRNGSQKTVNIQHLPLQLTDAAGEVVCKGGFKLSNFKVNPNTSKPWSFVFPPDLIQKKNPDFSSWKVQLIK